MTDRIQCFLNAEIDQLDGERPGFTEIRLNDNGTLDEICSDQVHFEQMDTDVYWMSVNGLHFWFRINKRHIEVSWSPNRAERLTDRDADKIKAKAERAWLKRRKARGAE